MKPNAASRHSQFLALALFGCLLAPPITLQAHPGHGLFEHGLGHALVSPLHLAALALAGGALFGGAHLVRQRIPRRALQGLGFMVLLVAAVLWAIPG